jgi:hypothetical protein
MAFLHRVASGLPLLVAAALAACSSSDAPGPGGAGGAGSGSKLPPGQLLAGDCDPLVSTQCGFPFPSSVWLKDDPTSPTKKRVAFGARTLPRHNGSPTKTEAFADADGFSPGQAPLTDMPGATVTGLPSQGSIELSITTKSPTILLDADSGELVPHFAELDETGNVDDDHALMIRPVVRLKDATRYIVAIRHVVDDKGAALAPTPVFEALRDGAPSDDPSVEARRSLYADIFAKLEKAGIATNDLQLAWDYTTASRENNTRWMLHMRDDALAKVGADGPEYTVDSVEENPNPHIRRRIHGHFTVPLYLDEPGPGGRLVLGPDGLPKQNGTAQFEFLVHVPNSATKGTPGALLQQGHGLLGDKSEGQDGYLATLADEKNYVAFAVDFVGFAAEDFQFVADTIVGDVGGFKAVVDRQHQGMLNSLLAMRMMKGRFVKDPNVQFGGKSAIDPTHCYYRGDSQGGIYGVTYMALSTDVTRGLLGEPGMPYGLLLNRSVDFGQFFTIMRPGYSTYRDLQLVLALVQMLWDRTEPDGYAPYVVEDMFPGTPKHDVLLHVAIGDHQVTPLGAHLIARTVKAKNLAPTNRTIWGVPDTAGPFGGSGMTEFSFHLPEAPATNTPTTRPDSEDPHDKVRELEVAHTMTDEFLRKGVIQQACTGPCDPE